MALLLTKNRKKLLVGAILSLLIGAAVLTLLFTNVFNVVQLKMFDGLYKPQEVSSKITLITIDANSMNPDTGLGHFTTWTRENFAKAINNINKFHPKVVVLDYYFTSKKDENGDNNLKSALENTVNPIIATAYMPLEISKKDGKYFYGESSLPRAYQLFSGIPNVTNAIVNLFPEADNTIRSVIPEIYSKDAVSSDEALCVAAADKFTGEDFTKKYPDNIGKMLINYSSTPDDFKLKYATLSFLDAYNGLDPAYESLIKDNIVLIGPSDIYFNDLHFTPVGKDKLMPGVEIQANAIQTILEGKFLRYMSTTEEIALIFILSFLFVFIFLYARLYLSVICLVVSAVIHRYLIAPFAFDRGLIVDLVHPYLVLAASFIAVYVYRYLTEFREKLALKGAFSRYVNPHIAAQVAEHPEQLNLGGEKREITVIFTDIAHFTSISEKLKAESLVAFLNEYLEAMTQVIQSEGGTVDKYEGDAVMAFFGAPLVQADHAARACNTALKMRIRLTELLKKWESDPPLPGGEPKPMIDFRCGISSGDVIVGNIGSKEKTEYTVIGDIVNLGSRLEGQNKEYDTRIVASEATWNMVKDLYEGRELDVITVVGKTQPIKIYELLNLKGQLIPAAAELIKLYNDGIALYHERKFAEGLAKFDEILKQYPADGPSKIYRQRCEVFRDFPPPPNWDGVFEKRSK